MANQPAEISTQDCETEVRLMARRTALLFSAFAATLVDQLGEEEGRRLIAAAVEAYGASCGSAIRAEVEGMGLPLSAENFGKPRDLPRFGFEHGSVQAADGQRHATVTYCPLADTFKAQGERARRLGRMYCQVDQAKQRAYNPAFQCVHVKNVLDGDEFCEFEVRPSAGADQD